LDFYLILSYDARNHELKKKKFSFHSGFPTKTLSVPLFSLTRATCLKRPTLLDLFTRIILCTSVWGVVCYCSWRCVWYICLLISFYLPTAICCLIILVYLTMLVKLRGPLSWTAVHSESDEFELCGRKRSCYFWVGSSVFVLRECAATQNVLVNSGVGAATKADDLQNAERGCW